MDSSVGELLAPLSPLTATSPHHTQMPMAPWLSVREMRLAAGRAEVDLGTEITFTGDSFEWDYLCPPLLQKCLALFPEETHHRLASPFARGRGPWARDEDAAPAAVADDGERKGETEGEGRGDGERKGESEGEAEPNAYDPFERKSGTLTLRAVMLRLILQHSVNLLDGGGGGGGRDPATPPPPPPPL